MAAGGRWQAHLVISSDQRDRRRRAPLWPVVPLALAVCWYLAVGFGNGTSCSNLATRRGDVLPSFGAAGTCAGFRQAAATFVAGSIAAAIGVAVLVLIRARHVWVMWLTALPLVTLLAVYLAYA